MQIFKAALINIGNNDTAVVWIDSKHLDDEIYVKKTYDFYKKLFHNAEVVVMILNEDKHPKYYGKKEIIFELKKVFWKKLNWQEFSLEESR